MVVVDDTIRARHARRSEPHGDRRCALFEPRALGEDA
jgi:hypothetical protein